MSSSWEQPGAFFPYCCVVGVSIPDYIGIRVEKSATSAVEQGSVVLGL